MQLLSVAPGKLLRTAVLMATSQTTKPLCKHRLLEGWSVGVQFFKDILVSRTSGSVLSGLRGEVSRQSGFLHLIAC